MLSQVKMYSKSLNACHTKIGPLKIDPTTHLAENLPTLDLWSTFLSKLVQPNQFWGLILAKLSAKITPQKSFVYTAASP